MNKRIVCVDFDGVIHSYSSGWQGPEQIPDPPNEGAIAWLAELVEHFEVHIFSSRSRYDGGREAMQKWLRDHAQSHLAAIEQLQFPTEMPPALVTIDDRAICFNGAWPTVADIADFKPWYHPDLKQSHKRKGHLRITIEDRLTKQVLMVTVADEYDFDLAEGGKRTLVAKGS